MNALVPQGKTRGSESTSSAKTEQPASTDRRRLLGFFLLLLAAFILLPELKKVNVDRQSIQVVHQQSSWTSAKDMPQLDAMLDAIDGATAQSQPIAVPQRRLEDTADWFSQYKTLEAPRDLAPVVQAIPPEIESAYVIQVGTFKEVSNANTVLVRLQELGYPVFTRDEGGYKQVLIGPQLRRQDAEQALTQVAKDLALQGIIKNFRP